LKLTGQVTGEKEGCLIRAPFKERRKGKPSVFLKREIDWEKLLHQRQRGGGVDIIMFDSKEKER